MRRVVVTGIGAVAPNGNTTSEFWENAKNGISGIGPITLFDAENFKVKVAAEIKDFDPLKYIEKRETKRMDRFCQFAVAAAQQAVDDSELKVQELDPLKFGVIVSSGIGGLGTIEKEHKTLMEKGPNRVSPLLIPMIISNMAAGNIAIRFGAKGPCSNVVTACATGTNSIGEAFRMVREGMADVMMAGGAEASITPLAIAGFAAASTLSTSEDPTRASIPFDAERSGFVMGEGAGVIILEELEHARTRGAKIYAEMVGYGQTCDAYHITSPDPEGTGAARAMEMAIKDAGIEKSNISYINAHGTSTPINDKFETNAIKKAFGEEAYKIPVSSSKSMTGHLLGAAGAVEAILCVKALEEGFIPPTAGYKVADPECDLDYVPNKGRKAELDCVMSNSLGFGGHNAVIIFKKW